MKNKCIVIVMLTLLLLITAVSVSASKLPDGLAKLDDFELEKISGLGQGIEVDCITPDQFSFRYSGNSDNAFQNAKGIINTTNISGNNNIVQNIIDLEINIMTINGLKNIDYNRIKNFLK